MSDEKTTHFGFKQVNTEDKVSLVKGVFDSVADKYDVMNDLMSFGIHRVWKRVAVQLSNVREGQQVLDLAGGTGDLTTLFSKRVGRSGRVVLSDINRAMLATGRDRMIDRGLVENIQYAQINAEKLPFDDNTFDCVSIAFGLRNVTDKAAALRSMHRVLKPGGRCFITYFLLNNESEKFIKIGESSQNLIYDIDGCVTSNKENPEAANGFKEDHIRKLYKENGLALSDPIHFGSWCGRAGFIDYQDIVIGTKK